MSKYNPEKLINRSADEIQAALVNHPDNANRRDEVDLLCSWRRSYERHMNEGGSGSWRAFQRKIDKETSQSMRLLTLLAERNGDDKTVFHADTDQFLALKRMLDSIPQEERIDLSAAFRKQTEKEIRLPPPSPELSPVPYPGNPELCRIYIKASAISFKAMTEETESNIETGGYPYLHPLLRIL